MIGIAKIKIEPWGISYKKEINDVYFVMLTYGTYFLNRIITIQQLGHD